jgi:hypothetical protein
VGICRTLVSQFSVETAGVSTYILASSMSGPQGPDLQDWRVRRRTRPTVKFLPQMSGPQGS